MALAIGFFLVAALGIAHHFALRGLDRLSRGERLGPNLSLIVVFVGLLVIHTLEILAFAAAYRVLLDESWMGRMAVKPRPGWSDLVYFSGINFVTLGYTRLEAEGPIRMVNMMQSLGGFMILTWSATFIFAAWNRAFSRR